MRYDARAETILQESEKKDNVVTKKKRGTPKKTLGGMDLTYRVREALFLALLALGAYFLYALIAYDVNDPGWSQISSYGDVRNGSGLLGAWVADLLYYLFGWLAFLFPCILVLCAWHVYRGRDTTLHERHYVLLAIRASGFVLILAGSSALFALHWPVGAHQLPVGSGGVLGQVVAGGLMMPLNFQGSTLILSAASLVGITLATGLSWLWVLEKTGEYGLLIIKYTYCTSLYGLHAVYWGAQKVVRRGALWITAVYSRYIKMRSTIQEQKLEQGEYQLGAAVVPTNSELVKPNPKRAGHALPQKAKKAEQSLLREKKTVRSTVRQPMVTAGVPALSLLAQKKSMGKVQSNEYLQTMAQLLEVKLLDFGVKVQVVEILPGPVVTRFELMLAAGVKASKITGLARDIARSLAVVAVRVVEIIPGKAVVGLEIPNEHRQMVCLSEVLQTQAFIKNDSPLLIALGKDIAGVPVVVDLATMPHLLVAGTTGAGKSVGVNGMLLSMLLKATPEQVRMILIDPKMLELSVYEGVPHLLTPVVIDMKEASNALRWCVGEMERRYQLMAAVKVRNIAGYNHAIEQGRAAKKPLLDPLFEPTQEGEQAPELDTMPFIVVVIDEFADMMMVVGKKVEELIARIAQKARAAGIHLILATSSVQG